MKTFIELTSCAPGEDPHPISINVEDVTFVEPSETSGGTVITLCIVYGSADEVFPITRLVDEDYVTVMRRINDALGC